MKKQYIYGAGDLAREIYNTILFLNQKKQIPQFDIKGFVVDKEYFNEQNNSLMGIPIISECSFTTKEWRSSEFIIGIGESLVREEIYKKIVSNGSGLMKSVIHPNALIMQSKLTFRGTFIAANTTVSIETKIGDNVIINQNCSIGHDCEIQDNSIICPGVILSGRVKMGKSTFVGSGAVILPKVCVGEYCIIGANLTLNKDVPAYNKILSVTRNINIPVDAI